MHCTRHLIPVIAGPQRRGTLPEAAAALQQGRISQHMAAAAAAAACLHGGAAEGSRASAVCCLQEGALHLPAGFGNSHQCYCSPGQNKLSQPFPLPFPIPLPFPFPYYFSSTLLDGRAIGWMSYIWLQQKGQTDVYNTNMVCAQVKSGASS